MFKDLISQGEGLRSTFTKELIVTNDRVAVSKWITDCMFELERLYSKEHDIYKLFAERLHIIGNLTLGGFDDLIGTLKSVEKENLEQEEEYTDDDDDPLVYF